VSLGPKRAGWVAFSPIESGIIILPLANDIKSIQVQVSALTCIQRGHPTELAALGQAVRGQCKFSSW
jgi:hypothetical protein